MVTTACFLCFLALTSGLNATNGRNVFDYTKLKRLISGIEMNRTKFDSESSKEVISVRLSVYLKALNIKLVPR